MRTNKILFLAKKFFLTIIFLLSSAAVVYITSTILAFSAMLDGGGTCYQLESIKDPIFDIGLILLAIPVFFLKKTGNRIGEWLLSKWP